jgi:predicted GNAT family N-acyltransferase
VVVIREGDEKDAPQDAQQTYEKGRQELIDALADYGETLTALRDDQWVAIAAFLKDNDYFRDRSISRLVIKARMRDLRASDQLSREALLARIVVEEY